MNIDNESLESAGAGVHDTDAQMATDASSPSAATAPGEMELELEHADPARAESIDVEIHDVEAEDGNAAQQDMPDEMLNEDDAGAREGSAAADADAEMAAESQDLLQQHGGGEEEPRFGVTDTEVQIIDAPDADTDGQDRHVEAEEHAEGSADAEKETAAEGSGDRENGQLGLEGIATTGKASDDIPPQEEPGQEADREDQADEVAPVQYDASNEDGNAVGAEDPDAGQNATEVAVEESHAYEVPGVTEPPPADDEEANDEEVYANAIETNDPAEPEHDENAPEVSADLASSATVTRPQLARDYLSHIDAFAEQSAFSPHVSLIWDNASYSLFRPSSSPSGDDEDVVFADEDGGEHELYFGSLEQLIVMLHRAFPALSGEGENEVILDFGILDMQISEDSVYASRVSLYDLDRIRIGMCQPELDRLQINLILGKRFPYRFNELAEHCYRMYAGGEDDDSATVQADGEQDESYLEEYDEQAGEHLEQVDPDYTSEQNVEDLSEDQQRQLHASKDERKEEDHDERSASRTDDGADSGEYAEEDEIHPPTDEHYEDPEFSQAPLKDEEEEGRESEEGEQDEGEAETEAGQEAEAPRKVEAQDVNDGLTGTPDEMVETIDPDAPLLDAAEQAEEYEETALDYEDGAAAEADAETNANGDDVADSLDPPDLAKPDEETNELARDYDPLGRLAAEEETVLVEQPNPYTDDNVAENRPLAAVPNDAEQLGKAIKRSGSKRNREELTGETIGETGLDLPEADAPTAEANKKAKLVNI